MLAALEGRNWTSAEMLVRELRADKRALREAANQSRGQIISGQQGYKLTRNATVGEIDAFTSRMFSQSRHMRERAMQVEKVRHGAVV